MLPAIIAYLAKERDANRQKGFAGMNGAADFIDQSGMAPPIDQQPVNVPQSGALAKFAGAMSGSMGEMAAGGMGEPSGFGWKQAANTAVPNIAQEGKFTPMAAMQSKFFDPYFGKQGKFNFSQNGPWRK